MRTEKEIKSDIEARRAEYQEQAGKLPAPKLQEVSDKVVAANKELSELYASDAAVCPGCGAKPIGILRTPEYTDRGRLISALYEVGCIVCPPIVESGKRRSYSAQGSTPQQAAENWNSLKWVEDRRS